ncbi:MAG: ATP-dependent DNA helicase RecG [Bacteroidales bacterium]|nr:ATP-dependent DNA helicase RecG [Bacteroidales bacterium]
MKTAWDTEIQYLPGVGPRRAAVLSSELGILTVGDLVSTYPFRHIDRSGVMKIAELRPEMACVQFTAKVLRVELFGTQSMTAGQSGAGIGDLPADGMPGKALQSRFDPSKPVKFNLVKRMSVMVGDGTGEIELVFFKGIKWMYARLKPGLEFLFFGKPAAFNGRLNIVHPEVDSLASLQQNGQSRMTGVYNSTEKLKNSGITGKVMGKLVSNALEMVLPTLKDSLPEYLRAERGLPDIKFALRNIHFPESAAALEKARWRLKFEELFLLQLSLLKYRFHHKKVSVGIAMPKVGDAFNRCFETLPFPLTGAQKRVIREIRDDMKSGRQMNRLLQGDVGSGKTMVAVLSALIAIGNGYQACIMAPTEVLARQHYRNICRYLEPTGVKAAILTGSSRAAERREAHAGLEDGSIGIIVGTHALIEDNVLFSRLGLCIVDEQHRFGVEQRARLWAKGCGGIAPHVLVMTATPIPRTLAMTLYGDLEVSVIDELPPGRKPVQTIHATEAKRPALFRFMKEQIALGRQVFIVYPLIFESEKMDYKNLQLGYEQIVEAFPFPDYKTAMVHGQQPNDEKKFNMDAFAAGRADILVATSVIEVGVDVPNASVMVIESAERFGLSQLHQLRGRVGRGSEKSFCVLMTDYKMSKESRQRIELMCRTEDGFLLAEEDMKMRGPGDIEGTQQSGLPVNLKIASLAADGLMLNDARAYAESVLKRDPELDAPENACLKEAMSRDRYQIKDYSKIS